jgi:hypothetical protein
MDSRGDAVERALGGASSSWTRHQCVQVHGARAHLTTKPPSCPEGDALVTALPSELLVVRVADCLPVLLGALDPRTREPRAVGAAHAGWRGLVAGVIENAVELLRRVAPGATVVAALGPAIGPCCFEVGEDVATPWRERFGSPHLLPGRSGRWQADLPGASAAVLARLGVTAIEGTPACTRCAPALFHSYRAEGKAAGRQAAFIGLRGVEE